MQRKNNSKKTTNVAVYLYEGPSGNSWNSGNDAYDWATGNKINYGYGGAMDINSYNMPRPSDRYKLKTK